MRPTTLPALAPCVGYVRVSTERQAGEVFTSLGDQRKAIEQLATRLGVTVDRWFTDAGASGATVEKRPEFSALLAFCSANRQSRRAVGHVLCLNASRFGRFPDPDQAAALRYQLKECGWLVRFAENDETENVTLRHVMRSIGDAQSTEYRDNLRRNSRRGARGVAEQGYWRVEAPLGYRRKVVYPVGGERVLEPGIRKADNEKVQLTPAPAKERQFVQSLFAAYDAGTHTLGDLVRDAIQRWPSRRWSRASMAVLLRNPAYVGDVMCGRHSDDAVERGESKRRPSSEWYGKRDAHPPLVDRALFDRIQVRLAGNRLRGRAARGAYLFSGIVYCTACGRAMVGGGGGRSTSDPSGLRRFYKCSSSNLSTRGPNEVRCPGRIATITRHVLDEALIGVVSQTVSRPTVQRAIRHALDEALKLLTASSGAMRARLADRRQQLERQRSNLLDAIADETITRAEASPRLESIRQEIAAVQSETERSLFAKRGAQAVEREHDRLLTLASDFASAARTLRGPALREWLRPWLHRAEFDKTTRELTVVIRKVPAIGALSETSGSLSTVSMAGTNTTDRKRFIVRRVSLKQLRIGREIVVAEHLRKAGGGR